ncbi:MAG: hypothetical protein MUC88_01760 [Planctomycetes bacterium]|jgi:type II secretion system protein C|nr:hypothetical protein [Planctomycetota bacterium]
MRYVAVLSRFVWVLNLVLLAVVLFAIAASVLPTWSAREAVSVTPGDEGVSTLATRESRPREPVDSKLILGRDIFRVRQAAVAEAGQAQKAAPVQPKPQPKREVSLRLLGTVVDPGGASYAVIENPTAKSQDVYRVGDVIGDVRLDRIEPSRVVVLNGGVRQTLELAFGGNGLAVAPVVAEAAAPAPGATSAAEVVRVASDTERQINTRASAASRSQATQFLRNMKLSPHEIDGKPDGLAISGVGASPLAPLVGLKDGDVIQSVNGHPVPDQAKAVQVMKKARNLGSARVQIRRGQENRSMTFRRGSW